MAGGRAAPPSTGESAATTARTVVVHRHRGRLARFVVRKLLITLGLLLGVTVVTFLLVQLVPGDPTTTNLSESAQNDPAVVAAYRAKWGLDQPMVVQYLTYLGNLLKGDLGISQSTGNTVAGDLGRYVPATLEIALPAMTLSLVISVVVGMWAAVRKDRAADHTVRGVALVGLSTPSFWLAILALYVFFYILGIAPNGGRLSVQYVPPDKITGMYTVDALLTGRPEVFWDAVAHLALPVLVLTCLTVSALIRFVRSAMLEVLDQDYVKAATAKGLSRWTVLRRHVLRAGLVQVVTVGGLAFASLLSGTVLIEQIYSWPGVGQYAYRAAVNLDLPAIMGVSLFVALVYTLVNLLVDLLYGVIDPRIRL
ncbi:ABC transporter permease [Nocardioides sp. SLBN-35]|uniref:ABC transporter permease n=1 Tax=Nocardioides sp. SLBN-35 TaxID=2768445 RepID=UPI0021B4353B|nr:ABC transporter permease [Nocardioides sp. SLBN-35]